MDGRDPDVPAPVKPRQAGVRADVLNQPVSHKTQLKPAPPATGSYQEYLVLYKHFANPVSRPQDAVRDRGLFVFGIFVDMKRSRS